MIEEEQLIPPGTIVYGADEKTIGSVTSADDTYMTVDTGDIPPLLYIPASAIFETREDGVYLTVSAEDALHRDWDREPEKEMVSLADADESRYAAIEGEDSQDEVFATMPAPEDLVEEENAALE